MILSISISGTNKDCNKFVITDTSDYESDVITSTRLKITTPSEVEYTYDLFPSKYGATGSTYDIQYSLADASLTEWELGVYKFVFEASTDDVTYETSSSYYFLNDCKAKKAWANAFEDTLQNSALTYSSDKEINTVSTARELIQASEEKFLNYEFVEADRMIQHAYDLVKDKCSTC